MLGSLERDKPNSAFLTKGHCIGTVLPPNPGAYTKRVLCCLDKESQRVAV